MPYITVRAPVRYHQMTLEEVLFAPPGSAPRPPVGRYGDTRTLYVKELPERCKDPLIVSSCIVALRDFTDKYESLYKVNRRTLYRRFYLPKRKGGYRPIDAPDTELKIALRELKTIFETHFYALHHTAAFAYVKKRCNLDAVKRHQSNQSRWFLKTDCSDFFGSTTPEFTFTMLSEIFPFSEVMKNPVGNELLHKALDLAFLDGGLPQGTPLSPMLTNLVMIPIDHFLFKELRDFNGQHLIYTRYADDIDISCKTHFQWREVVEFLQKTFERFHAQYQIKPEKTHYGNSNGRNFILGVMYNKDMNITLGYEKKRIFRVMLNEYLKRRRDGNGWGLHEVQQLNGLYSYYRKIEPAFIEDVFNRYGEKYGVNVAHVIRYDLKNL